MLNLKELKNIAIEYAKKEKGKEVILSDPLFHKENDRLYFQYLILNFVNEKKEDFRFKRPVEWFLQDINNGGILKLYKIDEKDFANTNDLPLEKIFENNSNSPLYDDYNFINKLVKKYFNYTDSNNYNAIYDYNVLKLNTELSNPRTYMIKSTSKYFKEMDSIIERLGDDIQNYFYNNISFIFNNIRNEYLNNNTVNTNLIKEYNNILKYQYPDLMQLYNICSNINGTIDEEFDNKLIEMLNKKNNSCVNTNTANNIIGNIMETLENLKINKIKGIHFLPTETGHTIEVECDDRKLYVGVSEYGFVEIIRENSIDGKIIFVPVDD